MNGEEFNGSSIMFKWWKQIKFEPLFWSKMIEGWGWIGNWL